MMKYWICYFVIFLGLITIHITHGIQYGINISSLIIDCSAAVHMCSFRTLSCGDTVTEPNICEQRIRKKKSQQGFLFYCGVSTRLRRVKK